jgi:hypothetical protein
MKRGPQISPLRYAPVEMTIQWYKVGCFSTGRRDACPVGIAVHLDHGKLNARSTYPLSSRPQRSGVERSAVSFFAFRLGRLG